MSPGAELSPARRRGPEGRCRGLRKEERLEAPRMHLGVCDPETRPGPPPPLRALPEVTVGPARLEQA